MITATEEAQNGLRIKASQILDLKVPATIARSLATGKDWRPIEAPVYV